MGIREYSDFLQKRSTSFVEHYKSMKQKIVIISQVQHLAEKELRKYETSEESLIFGSLI